MSSFGFTSVSVTPKQEIQPSAFRGSVPKPLKIAGDCRRTCGPERGVEGQRKRKVLTAAHRLHSSSVLGLPYRILIMNPPKGTTMESMGKGSIRLEDVKSQLRSISQG